MTQILGVEGWPKSHPPQSCQGLHPHPELFQGTKWTQSNISLLFSPLSALCWSWKRADRVCPSWALETGEVPRVPSQVCQFPLKSKHRTDFSISTELPWPSIHTLGCWDKTGQLSNW